MYTCFSGNFKTCFLFGGSFIKKNQCFPNHNPNPIYPLQVRFALTLNNVSHLKVGNYRIC